MAIKPYSQETWEETQRKFQALPLAQRREMMTTFKLELTVNPEFDWTEWALRHWSEMTARQAKREQLEKVKREQVKLEREQVKLKRKQAKHAAQQSFNALPVEKRRQMIDAYKQERSDNPLTNWGMWLSLNLSRFS